MASPKSSCTSSIFALPSELIEEVLIINAARGFPDSIAAFGRTCRHFHKLVYRSTDHHLWREVFLTTFDDPRPLLRCLRDANAIGPTGSLTCAGDVSFDWTKEFIRRMDAARKFRIHMNLTPETIDLCSSSQATEENPFTLTEALETIQSVLDTSTPYPSHQIEVPSSSPKFPPIVMVHASTLLPPTHKSRNTAWVDDMFKHGYPPALVKQYLLEVNSPAKIPKVAENMTSGCSEEGKLFHKLVFRKGFLPVPSFTPSLGPDPWEDGLKNSSHFRWRASQSVYEQSVMVREVARRKVYNLRYLCPERTWGPFLPAGTNSLAKIKAQGTTFPDFERELSRYMLNVGSLIVDEADSLEDDDEDFIPEDGDSDDSDEDGHTSAFMIRRPPLDSKFVRPKPHQVVPDYTFLAAVRLLVEANIQESPLMEIPVEAYYNGTPTTAYITMALSRVVDGLGCLDFGRMGSASAFWDKSWVIPPPISGDEDSAPATKDPPSWHEKGKQKAALGDHEGVGGWDWAGVTGQWVRVICWLDYRDLLLRNLDGYSVDDLVETIRFFPMTLRIRGYSKPPEPDPEETLRDDLVDSLVWKLPVIHVEGESNGSDVEDESYITRKIRGTVRMLRDGAVRWSMTSSYPGDETPEWATEGVQIGSIGSAVGVVGMWTGAEHATTDPLGPAWAWKIA